MLIAGFSALALLVLIAAFDNQGTHSWRRDQIAVRDGAGTARSWSATPVQALSAFDWRAAPADGEPGRIFWGFLASALLAVVLAFLLVSLVCRGVAAARGRWSLFVGTWFATAAAAGLALIAGSGIAGTALVLNNPADGGIEWSRGDLYYTLLTMGMLFGLFAGWLIGLVAVIAYGFTEGADTTSTDRSWGPSSDYDYGSAAPATGPDYSFSHGSPYSASAPTQQIVPPKESEDDPYGGGNRSY
jgi:hypothetical protein